MTLTTRLEESAVRGAVAALVAEDVQEIVKMNRVVDVDDDLA